MKIFDDDDTKMSQDEELFNKLVQDESFILWVYNGESKQWLEWISNNPDKNDVCESAKRMILSMKFKSETLPNDRIEYIKNNIEDNIIIREDQSSSSRSQWSSWVRRAAAVLLIVSVTSVIFFILYNSLTTTSTLSIQNIEKSTHKGQKLNMNLPDGTKITLNSRSKISYNLPFKNNERIVILEGEAFFNVVKDSLRPFKVISGEVITTVLGTSFNIKNIAGEGVEVSLVSGRIAVENERSESVILKPGEMAISGRTGKIELSDFDYFEMISWKDGVLVFNNANLSEIVEKLEGWYGVSIKISGRVEEDFHYTAKYEDHTLSEILQGIAFVKDLQYSIEGDVVEINFKPIK